MAVEAVAEADGLPVVAGVAVDAATVAVADGDPLVVPVVEQPANASAATAGRARERARVRISRSFQGAVTTYPRGVHQS